MSSGKRHALMSLYIYIYIFFFFMDGIVSCELVWHHCDRSRPFRKGGLKLWEYFGVKTGG